MCIVLACSNRQYPAHVGSLFNGNQARISKRFGVKKRTVFQTFFQCGFVEKCCLRIFHLTSVFLPSNIYSLRRKFHPNWPDIGICVIFTRFLRNFRVSITNSAIAFSERLSKVDSMIEDSFARGNYSQRVKASGHLCMAVNICTIPDAEPSHVPHLGRSISTTKNLPSIDT